MLTSPPYKSKDVNGQYYEWYSKFMREVERICSEYAIIFNSGTRINDLIRLYPVGLGPETNREAGGPFRVLLWTKGVSQYSYRWNPIFVYRFTEKWNINNNIWTDVIPEASVLSKTNHPYEDPISLYIFLIKMLLPNKNQIRGRRKAHPVDGLTILDPFMGHGTTAKACEITHHPWLGFEIDPKRCERANKRLTNQSLLYVEVQTS